MKLVLKHILRNIKEHKLRSIMILASITVACLSFVLTLTLSGEISVKIEETLKSIYGDGEVLVTAKDDAGINLDIDLSKYKYQKTDLSSNEVIVDHDGELEPALLAGFDITNAISMKLLPNVKIGSNEVVINKYTADTYKYHENDKITIKYNDVTKEFTITKIVPKVGFASVENDYPMLLTSIENIKILNEDYKINEMFFDLEDDTKTKEFANYIKDKTDYVANETYSKESIAESLSLVNSLIFIIFVITVLMIFFVMSSLSKLIIAERMPVIGTFRSIGASKNKMNMILLFENVIYAIVGGLIGSFAGYFASQSISKIFIYTDGIDLTNKSASIDYKIILIGVLFGILLQTLISVKAILKANKKPIKDIIFNTQRTRYRFRNYKLVIGIILLALAFILSFVFKANSFILAMLCSVIFITSIVYLTPFIVKIFCKLISLIAKKLNLQITLISSLNTMYSKMIISSAKLIVISMTSIFAILSISNTFGKMFESYKYIYDMDIIVMNTSKDFSEYDYLNDIEGIKDVLPSYFASYQTESNISLNVIPTFMGLNDSQAGIEEYDYKIKDLKNNEILVDEAYALKNKIKIGDKIDFEIPDLKVKFSLKVVGFNNSIYFSAMRNVIIMNEETYINIFGGKPTWLVIYTDENEDLDKLKENIKDSMGELNVDILTFDEYMEIQEEQTNNIMSVFYIIIGLAVILSIAGVINNQIISFIQRKRELATLNSTCMSKIQLSLMLLMEVIISCLIAIIISVFSSILMTNILENVLKAMSMYFDLKVDAKYIINVSSIMLFLLVIVSFIPMRKIRKLDIVKEIKYE